MKAKTATFSVGVDVRPTGKLPGARAEFTAAFNAEGRLVVHAAYLKIEGSPAKVSKSVPFDDAAVVIDYDAEKHVRGVEFLTAKTLRDLPEFFALAKREHEKKGETFLLAAGVTISRGWRAVEDAGNFLLWIMAQERPSRTPGDGRPIAERIVKRMRAVRWDTSLVA